MNETANGVKSGDNLTDWPKLNSWNRTTLLNFSSTTPLTFELKMANQRIRNWALNFIPTSNQSRFQSLQAKIQIPESEYHPLNFTFSASEKWWKSEWRVAWKHSISGCYSEVSKVRLTRNKQLRLSPFTLTPTPPPQHQPNPIRSGKSHSRSTNFLAYLQSQFSHNTDFKWGKYEIGSFPLSERPSFGCILGVDYQVKVKKIAFQVD